MKGLYISGILAAVLTLGSVALAAYPTFNGETGLVTLPNAYTLKNGAEVGAADLVFDTNTTLKARVVEGVDTNLEVGSSVSMGNTDGISASAKYRFNDQAKINFAGGGSVTLANHSRSAVDLYAVASESFTLNTADKTSMIATAGLHFVDTNSDNTLQPFVGVQYPLGNDSELAAEYQVKDGNIFASPLVSVAVRHRVNTDWAGQVGLTNATGFGTTSDSRCFVGAEYTFKKISLTPVV